MAATEDAVTGAAQAATPKKPKATGGYLFIPRPLQTQTVLTWLRRTHAWTGFFGAVFFFLLGLSAIWLNHRAVMQIPQPQPREVASLDVILEPGQRLASQADLAAWMQATYKIDQEPSAQRGPGGPGGRGEGGREGGPRGEGGGRPGGQVTFNGQPATQPETWTATFRGPNATITGTHQVGSNLVHVTRTEPGFLRMIQDLHKVIGVNAAFILLMDAVAGAMMFMSVSGLLLWTRLHGPRLAALGILIGVLAASAASLSGTWVSWTAP